MVGPCRGIYMRLLREREGNGFQIERHVSLLIRSIEMRWVVGHEYAAYAYSVGNKACVRHAFVQPVSKLSRHRVCLH